MNHCAIPLKIVILSIDFYPDVKRGGAVFAEKLHNLLRRYVKRVDAVAMFWSINVGRRNNCVYALRVPRGVVRLLFLPLYPFRYKCCSQGQTSIHYL